MCVWGGIFCGADFTTGVRGHGFRLALGGGSTLSTCYDIAVPSSARQDEVAGIDPTEEDFEQASQEVSASEEVLARAQRVKNDAANIARAASSLMNVSGYVLR